MVSVEMALRATAAVTGVAALTIKLEAADIGLTVAGAIVGVSVEEATRATAAGFVMAAVVVSELAATRDAVAERTPDTAEVSELVATSATAGRTVSMAVVVRVLVAVRVASPIAVATPGAPVLRTIGRSGLRRNPRPALAMGYHLLAR